MRTGWSWRVPGLFEKGTVPFSEQPELDARAGGEAEAFVERDRTDVLLAHVQERRETAREDVVHEQAHQESRVAAAEVLRVRAHAAHFDELRRRDALTRHRRQHALVRRDAAF